MTNIETAVATGMLKRSTVGRANDMAERAVGRSLKVRTGENTVIPGTVVACKPARVRRTRSGLVVQFATTLEWFGCTGIRQTKTVMLERL